MRRKAAYMDIIQITPFEEIHINVSYSHQEKEVVACGLDQLYVLYDNQILLLTTP
jgi:hypothetical protein